MMGALLIVFIGIWFFSQTAVGDAVTRIRSYAEGTEPDNAGPRSSAFTTAAGSTKRAAFVERLMRRAGSDYTWGGTTKKSGFDCSGLIYRVMTDEFGAKDFPRTSSAQIAHARKISKRRGIATPGAVLYAPGHIAVSRGDGTTIEARSTALDVGVFSAIRGRSWTAAGIFPELA